MKGEILIDWQYPAASIVLVSLFLPFRGLIGFKFVDETILFISFLAVIFILACHYRREIKALRPFWTGVGFEMKLRERNDCACLIERIRVLTDAEKFFWGEVFGALLSREDISPANAAAYVREKIKLYRGKAQSERQKALIMFELFGLCPNQNLCIEYQYPRYIRREINISLRNMSPRACIPCSKFNQFQCRRRLAA